MRWLAVAVAVLVAPLAADAQGAARIPAVGVLVVGDASSPLSVRGREAFERGLTELGWIPDRTVRIDYRYAEGNPERLEAMARDLVRLGVDVIVARATPAIRAAKEATPSVPIVMSGAGHDPVQLGLVASTARPGGNITGLTLLNQDLPAKQLQLLNETVRGLTRVAVLGSHGFPLPPRGREDIETAARTLGLRLHHVDVVRAEDLEGAFVNIAQARAGALLVRSDPFVLERQAKRVVDLAMKHRLPAIYWLETYTRAGGLMSYGADLFSVHHRSASYVDRLLRGARPMDLPIEEPSKLALIVNLKTARAIGAKLPQTILTRADEIIE